MKDFITIILVILAHTVYSECADFDLSICHYYNESVGAPMPSWPPGYSTNVEWKIMDRNTTVSVQEYFDPINKMRSITASIEGSTVQIIFNDEHMEYYTVINNMCTVTVVETGVVFFPDVYGLSWLTMTKYWYETMNSKQSHVIEKGPTSIRSTNVDHWTSCIYAVNVDSDLTAKIDFYFAQNWAMPNIDPSEMIPVRIEITGRLSTNNATVFHVVGDFFNFSPAPPSDPTSIQPPPGIFCPGKYPGKPIIQLPTNFYGIIEIVDRIQQTITFQEIWFHYDKKVIRYDTKDSDGSDSDPYMTILDFNTGIGYRIDKYMGQCQTSVVVVGDNFVKAQNQHNNDIDIVSVEEFFHLANAEIQYVGKRWARNVLCDVWVGNYFDDSVSRNFTAEWYFAAEGWREAVGLSLQIGSFIKMDVYGGAQYPVSYHIHRMDPNAPPLSVFDISNCFSPSQKAHFIIRFAVSGGSLIPQISQFYLQDTLHSRLTETAQIQSTRLTNVFMEYYGGHDFYFVGTLLNGSSTINSRLYPPAQKQIPLDAAFGFLRGIIEGNWATNVSTSTGQIVTFSGVNIIQLNYRSELTTTTVQTTPTLPYNVPTIPHPTLPHTTKYPTPAVKPSTTTQSTTKTTKSNDSRLSTTKTTQKNTSRPTVKVTKATSIPCTCPKTTCPAVKPQTPLPVTPCPTLQQTVKPAKQMTSLPIKSNTILKTTSWPTKSNANLKTTSSQPNCSAIFSQLQRSAKTNSNGIGTGGAVGLAFGMLSLGLIIGFVVTRLYHVKFAKRKGLLYEQPDDDSRY